MKILAIYTYPHHDSLNGALLQAVLDGAAANKNISEVRVIDLYKEGFDPVLVFNKEKRRRDMYKDPEIAHYQELIRWADKLVFVYPIWWGRPPAMLLGFMDRLLALNFAYKNVGKLFPKGLLAGKSAVFISTMKAPAIYPWLFLGNSHRILMKRAVMNFVGVRRVRFFEFGNMESKQGKQEKKLKKVHDYFQQLSK